MEAKTLHNTFYILINNELIWQKTTLIIKLSLEVYMVKVGQKYTLQPCKDRVTGQYPDCVKYVDSKGDMIMTDAERNSGKVYIPENFSITFESGKEFNLDNPIEEGHNGRLLRIVL